MTFITCAASVFTVADRQNWSILAFVNMSGQRLGRTQTPWTPGSHYNRLCGTPHWSSLRPLHLKLKRQGQKEKLRWMKTTNVMWDESTSSPIEKSATLEAGLSGETAKARRRPRQALLECQRPCSENGPTPEWLTDRHSERTASPRALKSATQG